MDLFRTTNVGFGRVGTARCAVPTLLSAFTLVEFILVMALLAVVMAVAAPSLSNFFRARTLDSEAKRFVALTRFGQSQAVSEGLPMLLWIDRAQRKYGLRAEDAYALRNQPLGSTLVRNVREPGAIKSKEPEFRLAESLRFDVEVLGRTNSQYVTIRFLPDGTIDETSLTVLQIQQQDRNDARKWEPIWITQSRTRSRYEIVDQTNAWERLNPRTEMQGGFYIR